MNSVASVAHMEFEHKYMFAQLQRIVVLLRLYYMTAFVADTGLGHRYTVREFAQLLKKKLKYCGLTTDVFDEELF